MHMNLYVIVLLKIWMKQKVNFFCKDEHENKISFLIIKNQNPT